MNHTWKYVSDWKQDCKTSVPLVPLVPAVQESKMIWGEEMSIFYIFLYIFEGKFAIYSCCGTGKQIYIFAALARGGAYRCWGMMVLNKFSASDISENDQESLRRMETPKLRA